MVRDILHNPIYVGTRVGQKHTTVSYKNHKKYVRDKSEWIVKENAFEGIVSQELWDKVQEVNNSNSHGKVTRNGEILPLCGLMYCSNCGSKLKKCTPIIRQKTWQICSCFIFLQLLCKSRKSGLHIASHYA